MEVVVPCVVGMLAGGSSALLLGAGRLGSPDGAPGVAPWDARRLRLEAERLVCWVAAGFERAEAQLEARGILTPRKRAERSRVEAQMPEAFGALALSLASGLSLPQAMRYVGGHAPEPVRGEFLRASALMSCGVSAHEALDELTARLRAPGLGLVTLALKVSQRTGAPLAGLLSEAAGLVGDRIELARRLDVKTAQVRMSARLVAGMPLIMVGFLTLCSEDFRAGVATMPGLLSVVGALLLNAVAWAIIRSIMKVGL
ncbi:MAG: type II secretion system F family protein [Coriobacteriaceae bacterium]|nr:type II secretion system F family protein [Coriobacteriaceae bacterium]